MTETQLHGVFLTIDTLGVLLTGAPGVGKSSTALGLLDRGHRLIADDLVIFTIAQNNLLGRCPAALQDQLKIRSVELLNIRTLYGNDAICLQHPLDLIIHLENIDSLDVIDGNYSFQTILNINIPKITISPDVKCDVALLIECLSKNYNKKKHEVLLCA